MTKTQGTLVIQSDGTERAVPGRMSLEELRKLVGGYVELTTCMYQDKRLPLVVNEDGHSLGLPYNRKATELYLNACKPGTTHHIVGDVAVLLNWTLD